MNVERGRRGIRLSSEDETEFRFPLPDCLIPKMRDQKARAESRRQRQKAEVSDQRSAAFRVFSWISNKNQVTTSVFCLLPSAFCLLLSADL